MTEKCATLTFWGSINTWKYPCIVGRVWILQLTKIMIDK